jgi:hypothetical protein
MIMLIFIISNHMRKVMRNFVTVSLTSTFWLWRATSFAFAQTQKWSTNEDQAATFVDLEAVFANILAVIVALAGLAVFFMVITAGYKYLTSGGDPKKNQEAATSLTWAIFGLVFLLGAWFILRFITDLTGVNVTIFTIPS